MIMDFNRLVPNRRRGADGTVKLSDGFTGRPAASHPIVVRHLESGRKLLYVNAGFTTKIDGIPREESDAVLAFLYAHCIRPEWTTRFRWEKHSIAMWDNRCSQHRAICDYLPQVRSGYRIQIRGTEAPVAG